MTARAEWERILSAADRNSTRWFRMVLHERIPEYLALGWLVVADLGPIHGEWSMMMQWLCDCPMVEPRKVNA